MRPSEQKAWASFFCRDYMKSLFPDGRIRKPARGEMQHVCILGPAGGQDQSGS